MGLSKAIHELGWSYDSVTGPWGDVEYSIDKRTKLYKSGLHYTISFTNKPDYDHAVVILKNMLGIPAEWRNIQVRSANRGSYLKGVWLNWTCNTKWATSFATVYVDSPNAVKTVLMHYILAEDNNLVSLD